MAVATTERNPSEEGFRDEIRRMLQHVRSLLLLVALLLAVGLVVVGAVFITERIFVLKLAAAALLSILPGWLYLASLHQEPAVYDEYVLNLFRLKIDRMENLPMPPQHTSYFPEWKTAHDKLMHVVEAETGSSPRDNLYRRKFENLYGPAAVSTNEAFRKLKLRQRVGNFSPVIVASIVIALGWVLVLEPEVYSRIRLATLESGRPQLPTEALRFGFLGAYAFVLADLVRRYFRQDLRPDAYVSATFRVVFVALIVLTAHFIWGRPSTEVSDTERMLAFLIGFFPLVGLELIHSAVTKVLGPVVPVIRTDYPLSALDGLNIWYEARLGEEGIDDMQNLVSAKLPDLMLACRAPVQRLVDWVDQAALILHLPTPPGRGGKEIATTLQSLKRLGIRNATDLERIWACLGPDEFPVAEFNEAVGRGREKDTAPLRAILVSLAGETNLWHIRQFREADWLRGPGAALEGVCAPPASLVPNGGDSQTRMVPS